MSKFGCKKDKEKTAKELLSFLGFHNFSVLHSLSPKIYYYYYHHIKRICHFDNYCTCIRCTLI